MKLIFLIPAIGVVFMLFVWGSTRFVTRGDTPERSRALNDSMRALIRMMSYYIGALTALAILAFVF